MTIKAADHVVIVTGATSGFGRATAQKFANAGAHVVVAGRREDRLAKLKDEFGDLVHVVPLDVRDNAAVAVAFADLPAPFDAPTGSLHRRRPLPTQRRSRDHQRPCSFPRHSCWSRSP